MSVTGSADHRRIIAQAQRWSAEPCAIATVIETWSSAPCPLGTHMLIHADGRFVGSVSGGCVEADVLTRAADVIASNRHQIARYGIAAPAAWEVGLPCGGDIVVLIQPVSDNGFAPALFAAIAAAHARGEPLTITTDLAIGTSVQGQASGFANHYLPARRLFIVGAVETASALIGIADQLGIATTLIDPRARFLSAERFPGVVRDDRWPDEAIAASGLDRRSAVVTLSHDPKIDDPALIAALTTPAGYIAALGSKRAHAARIDRLRAAGVDDRQIARIEGPAGVTINAVSAPEIALSIAGGMIRALNAGLR